MGIDPQFNPFPGLRAFLTEEDYLFFGREEQISELLSRLRQYRFLSVLGASGSGKSSLVRAGMLPALEGGAMTSAGSHWEIGIMRPGGNPIQNLAKALFEMDLFDFNEDEAIFHLQATLKRSGLGLVESIKQSEIEEGANLLIVVDQFEELFRFSRSGQSQDEMAAAFVKLLLEASRQTEIPIYVAITMRSDYIGDCAQFPDLTESVNEGEYLVPRLKRDQRRTAIEGPIKVAGGEIAPRLTQKLLNDFGNDPDQLPILQHTLMRMWDKWFENRAPDDPLDLKHYEKIGGMEGALSQHADEVWLESKSDAEKQATQKLFQALTERGGDNRGIRRPTRLDDLCNIVGVQSDLLKVVVERFRKPGRTFLMPPVEVPLDSDTVIDISHESLMRVWKNLSRWVETESQSARIFVRLAETAQLHADGKAGLYYDPDLQIALSWRGHTQPTETWGRRYHPEYNQAIDFLDESAEAKQRIEKEKEEVRQRELEQAKRLAKAEQARAEEQTRSAGNLKKLTLAVGLAALLALVATSFALNAREDAQQNARQAENAKAEAEKNAEEAKRLAKLADESKFRAEDSLINFAGRSVINYSKNLQDNRDNTALAWLNDAAKSVESIPEAQNHLAGIISEHLKSKPLLLSRIKVNGASWPQGDGYAVSRNGEWIAMSSWGGNSTGSLDHRGVTVQNINTLETLKIPISINIHSVALSGDGDFVAANSWANGSEVWESPSGDQIGAPLKGSNHPSDGNLASSKDFHPTEPILATSFCYTTNVNNVVEVYNFKEKKNLISRYPIKGENSTTSTQTFFTNDGNHLVIVAGKTLTLFSCKTWEPVMPTISFDSRSIDVREAPGEGKLLIGKLGLDKSGKMPKNPYVFVSLNDGSVSNLVLPNIKDYSTFEYSSAGRFLALSRPNGDLGLYMGKSLDPYLNLPGKGNSAARMNFSTNERYLAVAYSDKSIRILDLEDSGEEVHRFDMNNRIIFLKFIPGRENRLFVGDNKGTGYLFAVQTKLESKLISNVAPSPNKLVNEWSYSISPNQKWLIASRLDGDCFLVNLIDDKIKSTFNLSSHAKLATWSSDSKKVAAISNDGEITVLSVRDGKQEKVSGNWSQMSLSPAGDIIAAVDDEDSLHILRLGFQDTLSTLKFDYPANLLHWTEQGDLYYFSMVGKLIKVNWKGTLSKLKVTQLDNLVYKTLQLNKQNQLLLIGPEALTLFDADKFSVIRNHQTENKIIDAQLFPDRSGVVFMVQNQIGKSLSVINLNDFEMLYSIPTEKGLSNFAINPNANSVIAVNTRGLFEQIHLSTIAKLPVPFALRNIPGANRLLMATQDRILFEDIEGKLRVFSNRPILDNSQDILNYALLSSGIEITPGGSSAPIDSKRTRIFQEKISNRMKDLIKKADLNPLSSFKFKTNIQDSLLVHLNDSLKNGDLSQSRLTAEKIRDFATSSMDSKYITKAVLACSALGLPLNSLTNKIDLLREKGGLNFANNAKFTISKSDLQSSDVTFSFWYRPRFLGNSESFQTIFSNENIQSSGVSFYQRKNDLLHFRIGNIQMQIDGTSSTQAAWTHISIIVSESTRKILCYKDGQLDKTQLLSDKIRIQDYLHGDYLIGKSPLFRDHDNFRGDFARLSIWSRDLQIDEIRADHKEGLQRDESLLICLIAESPKHGAYRDLSKWGRSVATPEGASFFPLPLHPHVLLNSRDLGVRFPSHRFADEITMALGFLMLEVNDLDTAEAVFLPLSKHFVKSPSNNEELFGRSTFRGFELMGLAKLYEARKEVDRETECRTKFSTVSGRGLDSFERALLKQAQRLHAKPIVLMRDKNSGQNQIDLRRYFNQRYGDDLNRWRFRFGSNYRDTIKLPAGLNVINGVKTEISGSIQLNGSHPKYINYPEIIKGIKVRRKIDRAVILHTALSVGTAPPKGTVVIEYRLVYSDGTKSSFPVRYMDEIGSWNQKIGSWKETIGGKESALNSGGSSKTIQINGGNRFLYHFDIINQNPTKVVDAIEIESMNTTMAPYVMAITVE